MGQNASATNRTSSPVGFAARDDPALLALIEGKKLEEVIGLLASGANPNIKGDDGDWAIHTAVKTGDALLVKLLICFDVNLTNKDAQGLTPFEVAIRHQHWRDSANAIEEVLGLQVESNSTTETVRSNGPKPSGDDVYLMTLDGGGIKGLVFIQVLLGIEKRRKILYPESEPFVSYFNWLGGTSTGAMAALAFAGLDMSDPLQEGRGLYLNVKNRILKQSPPYPNDKVDQELKKIYGENKTMASITGLNVSIMTTLADVRPVKLHIMSNYGEARDSQKGPGNIFVWEAARASSAAVPLFHPFDNKFLDGGFVANNPTIDTIIDIFKHKPTAKVRAVLSLGCGLVDHSSESHKAPDFPSQLFSFGELFPSFGRRGSDTPAPFLPWAAEVGIAMAKHPEAAVALKEILLAPMTETDINVEERSKHFSKMLKAEYFRFDPKIDNIDFVEWRDGRIVQLMYNAMIGTLKLIKDGEIDKLLDSIVGGKALIN